MYCKGQVQHIKKMDMQNEAHREYEKNIAIFDSILQKIFITYETKLPLYLYSDLF